MKILSLFDGISTGRYCLEKVGIPITEYYASEIEQAAIDITMYHYPNTIQLGDVTKIDFKQFEGKIDLLIGGSPCTSLSISNSKGRKHLEGESKLFFDYVRALEDIKPKYFFLENVASMNNESLQTMSKYMGCKPQYIDSADYFSAQERKRLYWFNWGHAIKGLIGPKSWQVPMPVERESI